MSYSYVIVGGGIYGVGTAWELARRDQDVVLLERDEIAAGASGGLGKRGVRANGRDPRELPLMNLAYDIWPSLGEAIGTSIGYERTGHLRLLEEHYSALQGGQAAASTRAQVQRRLGIPTEVLDADAVRKREPNVGDAVTGAVYCPNDGIVDHTRATRGLAEAAVREGAEIREGAGVVGLEREGTTVTGVRTEDGETVGVKESLIALSNVHAAELVRTELGVSVPVWPVVPQVMATEPLDDPPITHLIGHDSRTLAMKVIEGDRIMISGGWRGEWNDGRDLGETIDAHIEGNRREAVETFPALESVQIERADASRRDTASVDHVPIIDAVPGVENVIIGTGWTGHGFAISVAVTRLLAEWVRSGKKPEALAPFTFARFDAIP